MIQALWTISVSAMFFLKLASTTWLPTPISVTANMNTVDGIGVYFAFWCSALVELLSQNILSRSSLTILNFGSHPACST
jgi:hypothetical protein